MGGMTPASRFLLSMARGKKISNSTLCGDHKYFSSVLEPASSTCLADGQLCSGHWNGLPWHEKHLHHQTNPPVTVKRKNQA